ncbi:hypothetical protein Pcinc_037365, partial [Petrolisthes cinctipes]
QSSAMVVRLNGQNLSTDVAFTGNWPVSQFGTRYSITLLDSPATLTLDKVWPVCLLSDPVTDLGYRLDGFRANEKQLGYYTYQTIANGKQGRHMSQGLLSNCSLICTHNRNRQLESCPGYDLSTNLCVTGIHMSECLTSCQHREPRLWYRVMYLWTSIWWDSLKDISVEGSTHIWYSLLFHKRLQMPSRNL